MESAILGGYAEFVRKRHPDAPIPGFYLSERLFEDAVRMRNRIGDEAFFRDLNEVRTPAAGRQRLGRSEWWLGCCEL